MMLYTFNLIPLVLNEDVTDIPWNYIYLFILFLWIVIVILILNEFSLGDFTILIATLCFIGSISQTTWASLLGIRNGTVVWRYFQEYKTIWIYAFSSEESIEGRTDKETSSQRVGEKVLIEALETIVINPLNELTECTVRFSKYADFQFDFLLFYQSRVFIKTLLSSNCFVFLWVQEVYKRQ